MQLAYEPMRMPVSATAELPWSGSSAELAGGSESGLGATLLAASYSSCDHEVSVGVLNMTLRRLARVEALS